MLEWIIAGITLGIIAIVVGIWLGRRARIRRREAWQRFARKQGYAFDAETDSIRGEVDGVAFEIRAFTEEREDGEVTSYTQVSFEREVELGDLGEARTPLEFDGQRSGWRRPGRARRTKVLKGEVDAIRAQLTGQEQAGSV